MKVILATLALVSFAAGAQGTASSAGSEYQHQTPVDKMEVRALLGYKMLDMKNKGGSKTEFSGLSETVAFEYGVSEMISAGLELSNSGYDIKSTPAGGGAATTTKQSGLHDMVFFLNGRNAMGPGELRFGTLVNFSLGKNKQESNGNSNNASGGIGLTPFVGYEMAAGPGLVGARLSYMFWAGDRKQTDETNTPADEYTISGGSVFTTAFFYEMPMSSMTLGGALEFLAPAKSEYKLNGVKSAETNPHTETALAVYAPYYVNDMVTILPKIRYNTWTAKNSGLDSVSGWDINVGARFLF